MLTFAAMLGVWLGVAISCWLLVRRGIRRHNPRAYIRALPKLDPLTPVWSEPADPRRGHP